MANQYLLGCDIGTSSVKVSLFDIDQGQEVAWATAPKGEMRIDAPMPSWAEQHPEKWWEALVEATGQLKKKKDFKEEAVQAIGITYQMHGLVLIDKEQQVLRPSIIWCDSRAVDIGNKAFNQLGADYCLSNLLNSPGNFTASKLRWVQEREPMLYQKAYKMMLPGDYIAMKMTGEISTTASGLSEGILWNFKEDQVAEELLAHYGIDQELLAPTGSTFGQQGVLSAKAADSLGLAKGTPITYRAGDQPNNAFSLNVLHHGEIAATAGTSGVVYAVSNTVSYDAASRVNTFVHVNHGAENPSYGILLCLNGTGIAYQWLRRLMGSIDYPGLNDLAAKAPIGSDGLQWYPFGNGAERVLGNLDVQSSMKGLNFNRHEGAHISRAVQEGIAYSFRYGCAIIQQMDVPLKTIKVGHANLFLSPLFAQTISNVLQVPIEVYNTDGAQGAARGAGIGAGIYNNFGEAFSSLQQVEAYEPDSDAAAAHEGYYQAWLQGLEQQLELEQPNNIII